MKTEPLIALKVVLEQTAVGDPPGTITYDVHNIALERFLTPPPEHLSPAAFTSQRRQELVRELYGLAGRLARGEYPFKGLPGGVAPASSR